MALYFEHNDVVSELNDKICILSASSKGESSQLFPLNVHLSLSIIFGT